MFEGAKAYAAAIGAVVVFAILGYFIYSYHSSQEEAKKDAGKIAVQTVEIKDQANTITVQHESGAVTQAVVTERRNDTVKIDHSFDDVKRHEQAQIDAIHNAAATPEQPKVEPSRPTTQEAQVSAVRVDAMWSSYCLAAPTAEGCVK